MLDNVVVPVADVHAKPNWAVIAFVLFFHTGAVAALFFFNWGAIAVALVLNWMALCLGIGMSYHRLLTHRGYKCPKWMEYFLTFCATLALEGGPIFWVATHRIHHKYADLPGDPHSPHEGGYWAHIGWILVGESKHTNTRLMAKFAPDLAKDKVHCFLSRYHYMPTVVIGAALFYLGGWPYLLWPTFFRITAGLHFTWLVNSATHMWGSRRFETRDDSRNSWWVALLTFGEGWHNNHHAHPVSVRHGLAWYELDITWLHIKLCEKLGLATNVKEAQLPSPATEQVAA